jgi:hypothetical protein
VSKRNNHIGVKNFLDRKIGNKMGQKAVKKWSQGGAKKEADVHFWRRHVVDWREELTLHQIWRLHVEHHGPCQSLLFGNLAMEEISEGRSELQWALEILNMTSLWCSSSVSRKRVECTGLKFNWKNLFGRYKFERY